MDGHSKNSSERDILTHPQSSYANSNVAAITCRIRGLACARMNRRQLPGRGAGAARLSDWSDRATLSAGWKYWMDDGRRQGPVGCGIGDLR